MQLHSQHACDLTKLFSSIFPRRQAHTKASCGCAGDTGCAFDDTETDATQCESSNSVVSGVIAHGLKWLFQAACPACSRTCECTDLYQQDSNEVAATCRAATLATQGSNGQQQLQQIGDDHHPVSSLQADWKSKQTCPAMTSACQDKSSTLEDMCDMCIWLGIDKLVQRDDVQVHSQNSLLEVRAHHKQRAWRCLHCEHMSCWCCGLATTSVYSN